jgi:hypothetical protein
MLNSTKSDRVIDLVGVGQGKMGISNPGTSSGTPCMLMSQTSLLSGASLAQESIIEEVMRNRNVSRNLRLRFIFIIPDSTDGEK